VKHWHTRSRVRAICLVPGRARPGGAMHMHADEAVTLGPLSVTVRDDLVKRKWDVYNARGWFGAGTWLHGTGGAYVLRVLCRSRSLLGPLGTVSTGSGFSRDAVATLLITVARSRTEIEAKNELGRVGAGETTFWSSSSSSSAVMNSARAEAP
jgi:hypothetical protein